MHSDIHSIERIEIVQDLRLGDYGVLVGLNFLREGLDLLEVSQVVVQDAERRAFACRAFLDSNHWPSAKTCGG